MLNSSRFLLASSHRMVSQRCKFPESPLELKYCRNKAENTTATKEALFTGSCSLQSLALLTSEMLNSRKPIKLNTVHL